MAKENYDAKRAAILKQIHADKVKATAKAKKDAERAANAAPTVDDTVVDQVVVPDTQAA